MTDNKSGGWGTDCEAQLVYQDDNYYLLTWNDPPFIEIRNTKQVVQAIASSLAEDVELWSRHNNGSGVQPTRDIKELLDWLNAEQEGSERMPSENFISDECGYVWIRRILTKYEE